MRVRRFILVFLLVFLSVPFSLVKGSDKNMPIPRLRLLEVPEWFLSRDTFDGIVIDSFDILPNFEVAFEVAMPILKSVCGQSVNSCVFYEGYLSSDSLWVIYGKKLFVDGGYPYIELDRHTGRVVKIARTPVFSKKVDAAVGCFAKQGHYEVEEWIGYRYTGEGVDLEKIDILPTLKVAYDVAFPILKEIYNTSFGYCIHFVGRLCDEEVWILSGIPFPIEGGGPYIELDKHTGKIVRFFHEK